MGYTHYYTQTRAFTPTEWHDLTAAFHHMLVHLPAHSTNAGGYYVDHPLVIRDGWGFNTPEVDDHELVFNGDEASGMAHESFYLERANQGFHFCKTARKPYDLLVCAVLLVVTEIAPGAITVESDGDMRGADWQPARAFLHNLPPCPQTTGTPMLKELSR